MLRKAQLCFALAVVVPSLFTLAACGGGSGGATKITSIAITPVTATVPVNTTSQFVATVNLSNSSTTTNTTVTWEVNGVAGGTSSTGTIAASTTDVQVGIYTAPSVAPGGTNNGMVDVTAVATQLGTSTSTTPETITSNTAVVTVGAGAGLAITPNTTTVPAGGSHQFTATLNSVADPNATWTISSMNGGDIGSIDPTTGLYKAPSFPPPGATITVTATDGAATATGPATIVYSDASLKGPFAFSYSGDNSSGYFAVAGSFVSDGNGAIVSGVEDVDSFSTGASGPLAINGTYLVGPDGRGTVSLNSGLQSAGTLAFVLTTNQHGLLVRFDKNVTGSGTLDQQNLNDLTLSPTIINGPYVFSIAGADKSFRPMGVAGKFSANGGGGLTAPAILDAKINGAAQTSDRSLTGSYSFDATRSGTGRGTITLTSTTTSSMQYAFYVVDGTHVHLVEADADNFLAGDMFAGTTGNSFSVGELTAGNYPFTNGGTSSTGAYASGGVFVSDGAGNIKSGVVDANNAGTLQSASMLGSCAYTVDGTTGRIDLKLCPSGGSTLEFAAYLTSTGSAVMLELDSAATANGMAIPQRVLATSAKGIFALALGGQGILNSAPSNRTDASGQITLAGTAVGLGNLDINTFNSVFQSDTLDTTNSTIAAPDATLGRGTAKIVGTDPAVTFNVSYYIVDDNTALLMGTDTVRTQTGIITLQSPNPAN
jgi:hypothetical protein